MNEETNVQDVIDEIREADEETLRQTIEKWFESIRTQGLKIGASYISVAVFNVIKKHTIKSSKVSLRDYQRMTDDILKIISKQLTEQNDSVVSVAEETANDD